MNDYYEVRVDARPCNEDITDYIAALLADIGYESFVPDTVGLTAYIKAEYFDEEKVKTILSDELPFECECEYSSNLVPGQDWNSEWEKNYFKPIVVNNQCVIHGSFHTDIPKVEYDIVIDPKMAFGTGHHATTSLIISQLMEMPLHGKTVIDMGTGTGILAILAAMRGATDVYGVEIDGFAYENAMENVKVNRHPEIKLINGDATALVLLPVADVFIANINRNVILSDIAEYTKCLRRGGDMILSGFYEHDVPMIMESVQPLCLKEIGHTVKGDGWTCLHLRKEA